MMNVDDNVHTGMQKSSSKNNRYINLKYKAIELEHDWKLKQYSNCQQPVPEARLEKAPRGMIFQFTWRLKDN